MTLAEFRKRYPQYDDMSDQELAERLHRRHYFDMPFEEFAQQIGHTPPSFGPVNAQAPRRMVGLGRCWLPCWFLVYAAIISVFMPLRLRPSQPTPAMDVFPIYSAVPSVEREAPLRFSPSELLRPPLIGADSTPPDSPSEQETPQAGTRTESPSQSAALGAVPAESRIGSDADAGETQGEKAAVPVPAEGASPKVLSEKEGTKSTAKSPATQSTDLPKSQAPTSKVPTQESAQPPKVAGNPTPPSSSAKRQAARQVTSNPVPLSRSTAKSPATQSADLPKSQPATSKAPTQEPVRQLTIPTGSSKTPPKEPLPEERVSAPRPIPEAPQEASRTHAAAARPAPVTAQPANPLRAGTPPKADGPLFPQPGKLLAAVPSTPSAPSLGSHVERRPGKLVVRLEGPRPWVTESEVETVSGTIMGGPPVRLFLYVNDTTREVVARGESFQGNVVLQRGLNHIRVVATDWQGVRSEDAITVEYIPPKVPNGIAITSPRDGYTLAAEDPPVIQVEGQVEDPDVRTIWLVVNERRIAVHARDGRFRKTLPALKPVVRLWAELPVEGRPPRRSQALTVHTASPSPSSGFLVMEWPQGVTGNHVQVNATWRPRPERLDSPVRRVPLKVLGPSPHDTPPEVFTIRPLKPGVYTFVLEADEVWASDVKATLYLPGGGQLNARDLRSFSLMGTGKVVLAKALLPQGVLWEQDEWFTGQSISADTTTKFRLPEGIVWKEREGSP